MTRRAESARDTRQRIVEATFALHTENGIAATSVKDIAARANVGIGTVYFHFPTQDDVIRACGAHAYGVTRPPTPAIFEGHDRLERRIRLLVDQLFAFYERYPALGAIREERRRFAALDEGLREFDSGLESLVRAALRPRRASRRTVSTVVAMLDVSVYASLIASGRSRRAAARQISEILITWLQKGTK